MSTDWEIGLKIKTEKTIYDAAEESDGKRVLVMRYWPRGGSKDKVNLWIKDLGTERELIRKWKAGKLTWAEFKRTYNSGLRGKEEMLKELAAESRSGIITLLCGCKNEARCHRSLLKLAIQKYV